MKSYSGKHAIKVLNLNGWFIKRIVGSHHHLQHPIIRGTVTVPVHGKDMLHPDTLDNIIKSTGCDFDVKINALKKNLKKQGQLFNNAYTNCYQPQI